MSQKCVDTPQEPADPLRCLLEQRKKATATASGGSRSVEEVGQSGGSRCGGPRSAETLDRSVALFDVEACLGQSQSSRHLCGSRIVGDAASTSLQRIERALAPGSNVDFPTVTDICDRIAAVPSERAKAVALLLSYFGDERAHPRRTLKALTILNEMAYDETVVQQLRAAPDAICTFRNLQTVYSSGLGQAADEQIRMFATELARRCAKAADTHPATASHAVGNFLAAGPMSVQSDRATGTEGPQLLGKTAGILEEVTWAMHSNLAEAALTAQKNIHIARAAAEPLISAAVGDLQEQATSAAPLLSAAVGALQGQAVTAATPYITAAVGSFQRNQGQHELCPRMQGTDCHLAHDLSARADAWD